VSSDEHKISPALVEIGVVEVDKTVVFLNNPYFISTEE
jgi:hypothetical protein